MRNKREILSWVALSLLVASTPLALTPEDRKKSWDFDSDTTDAIASGFTMDVGEWKIVTDGSAPSKPNVFAQLAKNERPVFNVTLASGAQFHECRHHCEAEIHRGPDRSGGWR